MKVSELHAHFAQYFSRITKKLLDGSYQPQAVRKVQIPKPNGKMRVLGIPVARDRVIQQAIRQVIEPGIDRTFSNHSHGFRPHRSTGTALKQCAAYYEEGYKIAVDCDLKQCFDMLNHDKLMYLFERHVQDKSISTFIRRSLQVGAIDLSGEVAERKIGAPQGGALSLPYYVISIYMNWIKNSKSVDTDLYDMPMTLSSSYAQNVQANV
nr:reverse transcriptase domain-containing protein [Staphylococcus pseudintermedius]